MSFDLQPILEGDLVAVRPLREEDHDTLFAVASDPLLWEQHPARNRYQPDVFDALFRESIESGGALVVTDRSSGDVIGSSRYNGYDADRREVEIGWTFLARSHWGGAYNGELKRLMLDHAFQHVNSVLFYIGEENQRSQRAVLKIGARRDTSRDEGPDRLAFRIDRRESSAVERGS